MCGGLCRIISLLELCIISGIACLLPEKALVEQAFELRAELENAASDVSNLFAKIGMYTVVLKLEYMTNFLAKKTMLHQTPAY